MPKRTKSCSCRHLNSSLVAFVEALYVADVHAHVSNGTHPRPPFYLYTLSVDLPRPEGAFETMQWLSRQATFSCFCSCTCYSRKVIVQPEHHASDLQWTPQARNFTEKHSCKKARDAPKPTRSDSKCVGWQEPGSPRRNEIKRVKRFSFGKKKVSA